MNKKKKIQIQKDDYDFYRISLPFSVWKKKNQSRQLFIELGKLHPCFAESCSFDYKLRLRRGGFEAGVVVINKDKLQEYKLQHPGKVLTVEESPNTRFFVRNKKPRNSIILGLLFSIGFILVLICTNQNKSSQAKKESQKTQVATQTDFYVQTVENPFFCLEELFEKLKVNGGTIENFNWKTDGYFCFFESDIKNIYPEELALNNCEENFSSLRFINGSPIFHLQTKNRFFIRNETPVQISSVIENKKHIREIIRQYGGTIIEETIEPFEIVFECNLLAAHNEQFLLTELSSLFENQNLLVMEISVTEGRNCQRIRMKIDSFNGKESAQLLRLLQKYLKLLVKSYKKAELPSPVKESLTAKNGNKQKKDGQLGKVIHKDGSVTAFYKNELGKIEIRRTK